MTYNVFGGTLNLTQSVNHDAYPTRAEISTPDYIETDDSYNATSMSSQSHRPIIPLRSRPNGNRAGKLRVRV